MDTMTRNHIFMENIDLINRTLQERRINSHHRTKTAKCQSCRKSHRMLFCYSHIE